MTQSQDNASAAANSAAATVSAFAELSGKIERGNERIFTKLDAVKDEVNGLARMFAVHVEGDRHDKILLIQLRDVIHGENGIAERVNWLWNVDQVKVWGIRLLVGAAISVLTGTIIYGFKNWCGW